MFEEDQTLNDGQEPAAGSSPAGDGAADGATGDVHQPAGERETGDESGSGQRQSQAVPYDRFQQVNSEAQQWRDAARQAGYGSVSEFQQAIATAQQGQGGRGDEYVDPVERLEQQFRGMQEVFAEQLFSQQFGALKQQFPLADAAEVRDLLVSGRAKDVKTAMESQHRKMESLRQRFLADADTTQQRRAKAGAEGSGGGGVSGGVDYSKMSTAEFLKFKESKMAGYRG